MVLETGGSGKVTSPAPLPRDQPVANGFKDALEAIRYVFCCA